MPPTFASYRFVKHARRTRTHTRSHAHAHAPTARGMQMATGQSYELTTTNKQDGAIWYNGLHNLIQHMVLYRPTT